MKERVQLNFAERWRITFEQDKIRRRQHRVRIAAAVFVALGLLVLGGIPWLWQLKLGLDLTALERSISEYSEVSATLQEIEQLKAEIDRKEAFFNMLEKNSKKPQLVLKKIESLLPPGATIGSFSLQADNSVQISVTLPGPVDTARLWINLCDSGLFEEFDFKTVSLTDRVQSLDLSLKLK